MGRGDWSLKDAISVAGTVAAAVGALVYVLLSIGVSAIYAPLGVRPSEVGLNYGELLVRAAVTVLVVGTTTLAAYGAAFLVWYGIHRATAQRHKAVRLVAAVALAAVAALAGVSILTAAGASREEALENWGGVLLLFGFGYAFWLREEARPDGTSADSDRDGPDNSERRPEAAPTATDTPIHEQSTTDPDDAASSAEPAAQRQSNTALVISVAIATLIVVFGVIDSAIDGAADADRMRAGKVPDDVNVLVGLPPPWQARVARVTWRDEADTFALPPCLLYLGEAGGVSVFFDAKPRRALRLSTDGIVTEILPEATDVDDPECRAPS